MVLVALAVLAVMFVLPLYAIIAAAVKPTIAADATHMWQFPSHLSFGGLSQAWHKLGPNMRNSFEMAIPATAISAAIGALNGYVFAMMKFRYKNVIFILMLLGVFLPFQAILIPLVQFLSSIHLGGTLTGLVLVHVIYGIPFTSLIFRNYYSTLPGALIEAASIDGASHLRTLRSVILPLSLPGFVVCGIFQFTNIWNDFLFGLVVIGPGTKAPITIQLNNLAGTTTGTAWNVMMSGALVAAIPTALVYLLFGKYFVRGLTAGAVK